MGVEEGHNSGTAQGHGGETPPGQDARKPGLVQLGSGLVSSLLTAAVIVKQSTGTGPADQALVEAASVLAIVVGAFQGVNTVYRATACDHWKPEVDARPLLVAEAMIGTSLAAAGVVGLLVDGIPPLAMAIGLTVGTVLYGVIEWAIADKVRTADVASGTTRVGRTQPLKWLHSGATVQDVLTGLKGDLQSVLSRGRARNEPVQSQDRTISVTRIWLLGCLALAACLSFAATFTRTGSKDGGNESGDEIAVKGANASGGRDNEAEKNEKADGDHPRIPQPDPSKTCKDKVGPGVGAPRWAARQLYDAYVGPGGPGTAEAGCPIRPVRVDDDYVFQVGKSETGDVKGVAVASRKWGRAIFIAPAAGPVLDLIVRGELVGGTGRRDRGDGDFYLLYTGDGTRALVRSRKTALGRPSDTQRYLVLPPVVAEWWAERMKQRDRWLWPRQGHKRRDGTTTFRFHNIEDKLVARLRYEASTDTAAPIDRDGEEQGRVEADGDQIDDDDLVAIPYR